MKYDFIAIIFPHSFDSTDLSLAFWKEFPIVRTVFIPAIGVAGNGLFVDMIGLLLTSLSLTWFYAINVIADCEGVEWGAFDVIAVAIGL